MSKDLKNLLYVIFSILFVLILGYLDFEIITPLLPLPKDVCYYHTEDPPFWVRLFYLDNVGHTEPPYSMIHISILIFVSFILAFQTVKKINIWYKS